MSEESPSRPGWLDRNLFPFDSHILEIGDIKLHYVDEGSGPTLLMLHGNPTWSFLYRHIISNLRDTFRCIAVDYPGMGLSKAPKDYDYTPEAHSQIIEAMVAALDLNDIILMGQDWGGPIGLSVAINKPERFQGLILGNTFARPVTGLTMHHLFAQIMGGALARWLILKYNAFIPLVRMGTSQVGPSKAVMRAYAGPYPSPDSRLPTAVFPHALLESSEFLKQLEADLPCLKELPLLLVWGDRDILLAEQARQQFEDVFPQHQTVILHGANHFIQEDAPEEIAASIRRWWARVG